MTLVSDERLRELERRWKETGAPDDAERYLQEKLRCEGWPYRRIVERLIRYEWRDELLSNGRGARNATREAFRRPLGPADVIAWLNRRDSCAQILVDHTVDNLRQLEEQPLRNGRLVMVQSVLAVYMWDQASDTWNLRMDLSPECSPRAPTTIVTSRTYHEGYDPDEEMERFLSRVENTSPREGPRKDCPMCGGEGVVVRPTDGETFDCTVCMNPGQRIPIPRTPPVCIMCGGTELIESRGEMRPCPLCSPAPTEESY